MVVKYKSMIKCKKLTSFIDITSVCSPVAPENDIQPTHPNNYTLSGSQALFLHDNGAYRMILDAAKCFGKPFVYDDIIPLLRQEHDWLPKTPTLERYIRELCKYKLLVKIRNGVYQYNEVRG